MNTKQHFKNFCYNAILAFNKNGMDNDISRYILDFINEDIKKKINYNFVYDLLNNSINFNLRNNNLFNNTITFHSNRMPFPNINPSSVSIKYLCETILNKKYIFSHFCCSGKCIVFIKNFDSIRKQTQFPVIDISGTPIGLIRYGRNN
jgi:hypothetical protein